MCACSVPFDRTGSGVGKLPWEEHRTLVALVSFIYSLLTIKNQQVDMIDESLKFAGITRGSKIRTAVDVGCGIGGSSRHIVRRSCVDRMVDQSMGWTPFLPRSPLSLLTWIP